MTPKVLAWVAAAGGLLVILGAALGWGAFPYAVNLVIGKELALKDGSDAFQRFVDLPLALDMKLSIFNVTNVEEIKRGAKPRLQELGPYVYKQHRIKYNVSYNEKEDTWSYHQKLIHIFDPVQSAPFTENDKVTVIHPALMSMLGIMQNIPVLAKGTMFVDAAQPKLFREGLFVTTTADKLLFRGVRIPCGEVEAGGVHSAGSLLAKAKKAGLQPTERLAALITCSSLKRIKVPTLRVLPDGDVLFSLFGYKNDTFDGQYTVRSGIRDPTQLAQITAWEGKHFVSAWGGPTCNAINGTQGDIFSPYITKDTTISVFSTDICRSMPLQYVEDAEYRGISGYRFSPSSEVMASPVENGNNYCFCPQVAKGLTKQNGCLRRGAMDLSGCQGIPVIVTYPHFYDSDPFFLEGVEGLNPRKELHRMELAIEPMTGTPLIGGKKMQLNFQMQQVEGVNMTNGVRDTLFPVAWMYEGAQLNDELLDLLNNLLFSKLKILDGVKYAMLALGAVMLLVGSGGLVYLRRRGPGSSVAPRDPPKPDRPPAADGASGASGYPVAKTAASATAETALHRGGANGITTGSVEVSSKEVHRRGIQLFEEASTRTVGADSAGDEEVV